MLGDPQGWRAPLLSHVPGGGGAPNFPGYFTGLVGSGTDVSLDPRFRVSRDPAADRAYRTLGQMADTPWEPPREALDDALREYGAQSGTSLAGAIQGLQGAGRGLRASDEERLRERTAERGVEDRQSLREIFGRLAASDRIKDAQRRETLFGSLPGLDLRRSAAAQMNADRLLSEQQALNKYQSDAYEAKIKQNMSDGLAAAAG